ncbi:MAG: phosphodiester glycosidase family protein [Clostridia bacterium]|nr:phosphodiester glycosidase family protein [Clostridia bacterium]
MKKFLHKFACIVMMLLFFLLFLGSACGVFLIYGPMESLRELWVTTAMETFHHQYLAKWFFPASYITEIVDRNKAQEIDEEIDLSLIHIGSESETASETETETAAETETETAPDTSPVSETETEPPPPKSQEELVTIEKFSRKNSQGLSYDAYMMIVEDPTLLRVGVTSKLGKYGETLRTICEKNDAFAGINAAGFSDPEGKGNGAYPEGVVMKDGVVIWNSTEGQKHDVIAVTWDGKLLLKRLSDAELTEYNIRDAVEFNPFLIVNGVAAKIGVTGVHPRAAIGQTADGRFLLLIIDGRSAKSAGATQKDVIDIMLDYGAVNCANLDGGSSATMVFQGKLINKPSSISEMRSIATSFIVLDPVKLLEKEKAAGSATGEE